MPGHKSSSIILRVEQVGRTCFVLCRACCTTTRGSGSGSLFGNSRVKRTDESERVLPLFDYYVILNYLKGPILVHCIPYYWVFWL